VRGGLAFGVLALVFLALVDALDVQRGDLLGDGLVDLALEPDEGLVLVLQLLVSSGSGISSSLASCLPAWRGSGSSLDVFGDGPDAGRRHAGGQQQAVAVEDAAAVGRQLQRAREAHLALLLEEVVVEHLHVGGAAASATKPSAMPATMNLLRQTGVLLASSGLEV
jgi:hypothetical protein